MISQDEIDRRNREFWDELCGSSLARALGITTVDPASLRRFDDAYLQYYPYLSRYVDDEELRGRRVLEVGLGYGTLGRVLASHSGYYVGMDIAAVPAAMMRYRLHEGSVKQGAALQGSVLGLPFADGSFEFVYSIGCLHHTGDLPKAVGEIHRVLRPGGRAVVMLYNLHSFRRLISIPAKYLWAHLSGRQRSASFREFARGIYDYDSNGKAAPHTEFVSRADVRRLFHRFARVAMETRNFDNYVLGNGRMVVKREWFLDNLARFLGLDLYIVATR